MYFTQPPIDFMAIEWDSKGGDEDGSVDWTMSSVQKKSSARGMTIWRLFGKLMDIDRPAWIEGRCLWEECTNVPDLAKVVVE